MMIVEVENEVCVTFIGRFRVTQVLPRWLYLVTGSFIPERPVELDGWASHDIRSYT